MQLSTVSWFRIGLCMMLQALGLQAHAADTPKVAITAVDTEYGYGKSLRELVHGDTLQSMLSTQQLRVFVRKGMHMEWSVTRAANDTMELGEPELGLALGLRLRFK